MPEAKTIIKIRTESKYSACFIKLIEKERIAANIRRRIIGEIN